MDNPPIAAAPPKRRPLFAFGLLMVFLGPAIYFLQIRFSRLTTPWYVPVLATFGVLLMAASVFQRRGIVRILVLVLMVLWCGFEWFFVAVFSKSPPYEGPLAVGRPFPTFATSRAEGSTFTNKDLETSSPTAMIFFRGRW
jgi:hypothetical protein